MNVDQFIRVLYDDRRRFPWVVAWGIDRDWCSCRTRDAAQDEAAKLRELCRCFLAANIGEVE